jgi:hypothetical protein
MGKDQYQKKKLKAIANRQNHFLKNRKSSMHPSENGLGLHYQVLSFSSENSGEVGKKIPKPRYHFIGLETLAGIKC